MTPIGKMKRDRWFVTSLPPLPGAPNANVIIFEHVYWKRAGLFVFISLNPAIQCVHSPHASSRSPPLDRSALISQSGQSSVVHVVDANGRTYSIYNAHSRWTWWLCTRRQPDHQYIVRRKILAAALGSGVCVCVCACWCAFAKSEFMKRVQCLGIGSHLIPLPLESCELSSCVATARRCGSGRLGECAECAWNLIMSIPTICLL